MMGATADDVPRKQVRQGGVRYLPYHQYTHLNSLFNFLRCSGPRCLQSSRSIEVDDDEFHVLKLGQGGFATISRVWHKPSGEVRVIKRNTFDEEGLAEMLAEAEVDSLQAMKGSPWFPELLNHFREDDEFVIAIVSSSYLLLFSFLTLCQPYYSRGDLAALIEHKGYLCRELALLYCSELVRRVL